MATLLDVTLLGSLEALWPFLLVFAIGYAVLSKWMFKEQHNVAAIVAFVLAILAAYSPITSKTINLMAPWFVLLFIFAIFIIIAYSALGVPGDKITAVITSKDKGNTIAMWIIALSLIIGIGSLASVVSQEQSFLGLSQSNTTIISSDGVSETSGFFQTLVHPKVLGLALVLLIAYFTVSNLTERYVGGK